jgi:multicomponent K+:H+ antiporter subunit A
MNVLALAVALPLLLGTSLCAWAGAPNTPARRLVSAWIAAAITAASMALVLVYAPVVMAGGTVLQPMSWVPSLGLSAGFRLDGLALMFALMITGIGLLVILYGAYYMGRDDPLGKLCAQLMLFMAAMLGVVLSDNLLLLVVFWELTSVSSFLLVGYWGQRAEARAGALMALTVTGAGGMALLGGAVVLGQIAGTFEISALLTMGEAVRAHPMYPWALGLILLGCLTKSAQVPFHFWLPQAMAAPTPVSAYLHSATMVKAGIFLLARLYPVIGGPGLFELVVTTVGLATMVYAAFVAVFRHDIKGLLAYSTISHLGLIVFLLGLSTPLSAVAAVFHILNHATFKASLFMTAGIVDHETGTRDMRRLGGLLRYLPVTATLAMIAAASMAGVPLANGFLSKEMFFSETVAARSSFQWGIVLPLAATFGGICSVAYSLRLVHDVFFGPVSPRMPNAHPHEPPMFMRVPVALLVVLCVVVGVAPALTFGPIVHVAAAAVLGAEPPAYHLALWHGVNIPLAMSAVALVGGVVFFVLMRERIARRSDEPGVFSGAAVFNGAIDLLLRGARWLIAVLEAGSWQRHAAWMVAAAVVAASWPLIQPGAPALTAGDRALVPAPALAVVVWLLLLTAGGRLVLTHHDRFESVVLVGAVGLVVSTTFMALSAPDLALTQLTVEVVSTVLLLMGLALLPATTPRESSVRRKVRDAVLAVGAGGGMAWIAWLVMTRSHDSLSWFFVENALPGGGGSNIVNVILVDFRGYDTLGEITVLAIAALGAAALLDGMKAQRSLADAEGRVWSFAKEPLLLRAAAMLVLPLALVVSLHIFWRGHNEPGGGFIAGLITAAAIVLQYVAAGLKPVDDALGAGGGRRYTHGIGFGLGIAMLTGLGAFASRQPFLTSAHDHPVVPVLGELPLATATLFDLGVYVTVVGATLLMLSALGRATASPLDAKRPAEGSA